MLQRVLAAVADAEPRVVVGPPRAALPAGVAQVREEPPGGGPVAALAAGVDALAGAGSAADWVAVLAADLPYLTPATVGLLRAAVREPAVDGVLLVDEGGRAQLLCGVWRLAALRARFSILGGPTGDGLVGASMRSLLAGLRVGELALTAAGSTPPPWYDCDTEEDLRRTEEWA